MNKSARKKWVTLMSFIGWEGQFNWGIINDQTVLDNIPKIEHWARMNLRHLESDARRCFKEFYWPTENSGKLIPYDYTRKTYAEHALLALYNKEIINVRNKT